MGLQRIVSSIQRECTANPKKGLVLALLLVVGVYFWGPILKRWLAGAARPSAVAEEVVVAQDDPQPEAAPVTPAVKLPSWDKIDMALAKNAFARPLAANQATTLKNPFLKLAFAADAKVAGEETEQPETPMLVPEVEHIDPAQVNLLVKSVSIGPKRRYATFRGQVYALGDKIPVVPEDAPSPTSEIELAKVREPFELVHIETWGVVLTRAGKEYQQFLAQPRLKKFDRIAWEGHHDETLPDETK